MSVTFSREYLQGLAALQKEAVLNVVTSMKSKHIHATKAAEHITHIVLDVATRGRSKLILKNFNKSSADTMIHEWNRNILYCEDLAIIGPHRANHIAEDCLDYIVEKLNTKFPGTRIEVIYSGRDFINSPRLVIDWS